MPATKSRRARRKPAPAEQPISRELHSALADHCAVPGQSLHKLAAVADLDEAALRKFQTRERSLTLASVDKLAVALNLKLVRKARKAEPRPVAAIPDADIKIPGPDGRREPAGCPMVNQREDEAFDGATDSEPGELKSPAPGPGIAPAEPACD